MTMVELMVAIALAMLINGAAIMVYLSGKQTYQLNDALSRFQENMRYASSTVEYDLRLAGNLGCNNGLYTAPTGGTAALHARVLPASVDTSFQQAVIGFDAAIPAELVAGEVVAGSDVFRLQFAASNSRALTGAMASTNGTLSVNGSTSDFAVNDVLMVADCSAGEIFSASTVATGGSTVTISHGGAKNSNSGNFAKSYGTDAELMRFINRVYYVGPVGGTNMLLRKTLQGGGLVTEQIAEGIEDMQVLYGLDSTGSGQVGRYVTASSVPDWNTVRSVQLCLLFVSADNGLLSVSQQYTNCRGATVTAPDRRMRQTMITLVALRNRL